MPPPELQVPVLVGGVERFRIDLGVEEVRFAAEYDGEEFHGAQHKNRDEARRTELDEVFGWSINVFRRGDVYGAHETATSRLPRGLFKARRRHHMVQP